MSTKYTYSIQNDFPNSKVDPSRITNEIGNSDIVTILNHINTDPVNCDIYFVTALSGTEETTLSGVVSGHNGNPLYSKYEVDAGEDVGANKAVYISAADEIKLAKADSESTIPCVGFTTSAVSSGVKVKIQTNDVLGGFSGLTPAAEYYLSQTVAGELTTVKPSSGIVIRIGVAKNSSEMDVHILRLNREGAGEDIHIHVGGNEGKTTLTTWKVVSTLIFRGTNKLGAPKACKYLVVVPVGATGYYRLNDLTNDNIISNISVTAPGPGPKILSDATLNNIPNGEAVFEILIKSSSTTKEIKIKHFLLEF